MVVAAKNYSDLSKDELVRLLERGIVGVRPGLDWFGRRMKSSAIGR
ncbi:MAG: hypothetical protein M3128_00165 [Verrucomicrobiota bacterium]|nr:hypothetical protein [Verrucomicrobiota bacterium]